MVARWTSSETDPDRRKLDQYYHRTYGITLLQYEAILEVQGGVCAICLKRPSKKRHAVDHDHRTGRPRGALCSNCNHRLLGRRDRDPELFKRAWEYLENPPANIVLRVDD